MSNLIKFERKTEFNKEGLTWNAIANVIDEDFARNNMLAHADAFKRQFSKAFEAFKDMKISYPHITDDGSKEARHLIQDIEESKESLKVFVASLIAERYQRELDIFLDQIC